MLARTEALARLETAFLPADDVFVNKGVDLASYLAGLEADVRQHLCEPFEVEADVMAPGFPFAEIGTTLRGYCVAKNSGYWLVYQPEESRFLCFWGTTSSQLSAHGVFGSPLYCWSA